MGDDKDKARGARERLVSALDAAEGVPAWAAWETRRRQGVSVEEYAWRVHLLDFVRDARDETREDEATGRRFLDEDAARARDFDRSEGVRLGSVNVEVAAETLMEQAGLDVPIVREGPWGWRCVVKPPFLGCKLFRTKEDALAHVRRRHPRAALVVRHASVAGSMFVPPPPVAAAARPTRTGTGSSAAPGALGGMSKKPKVSYADTL